MSSTADPRGVAAVLATARRGHAGLFWFAAAMGGLAVVTALAAVLDDRALLGAPIWLKPLKFALSFGLYALALAWMIGLLDRDRRAARAIGWVLVVGSAIEVGVIVGQVVRGRRSHFNEETPLDASLYSLMGATVAVIWLATAVLAVVLLRRRVPDPGLRWGIRLGLVVGLLGMGLGALMVDGGAHAVGVADGGPGAPLFGWSTEGGDLRVGHFVGIHALQVLPLLAGALAATSLDADARRGLVVVVGGGYLGLVVLTTWQALRGQPLLAPDGLTLAVLGGLVVAVGVAALAVLAHRTPARGRTEVLR
ncbi:hypothetical protein [Actinomycetospora straminea]|uniref:Uncharacterized protein n=1 Tax=Actinomycetospora straminea TaxID=663607 RepID=A0ABP9E3X3_9PSEU|nr:hypothetical protein [Actinomycetospora straminea]MDD7931145.1 hypothetical protein [Actinomycetospora straminea]